MRALLLIAFSPLCLALPIPTTDPPVPRDEAAPAADATTAAARPPFEVELLEAARQYRTFGRVDDEVRWAPYLCRMPMPSVARVSDSDDERTHGRKLYYILAKNRDAYVNAANQAAPIGQVIVKESWQAVEIADDVQVEAKAADPRPLDAAPDDPVAPGILRGAYLPLATSEDGRRFTTGEKGPLFVMMKTDAAATETDEGWIYATLTADGKRVTASGRLESCMRCHVKAEHDRQFGLKEVPRPRDRH